MHLPKFYSFSVAAVGVVGLTLVSCTAPPVLTNSRAILPPTPYHDHNVSTAGSASLILQSGMVPVTIDGQAATNELRSLSARRDMGKITLGALPPMQSVEWFLPPGHHKIRFAHLLGGPSQGTFEVEGDFGTQVQYGIVSRSSSTPDSTPAFAQEDDPPRHESTRHRCTTLSHVPSARNYYNAFFAGQTAPLTKGTMSGEMWVYLAERDKNYPQNKTGGWRNAHGYRLNTSEDAKAEVRRLIQLVYTP